MRYEMQYMSLKLGDKGEWGVVPGSGRNYYQNWSPEPKVAGSIPASPSKENQALSDSIAKCFFLLCYPIATLEENPISKSGRASTL